MRGFRRGSLAIGFLSAALVLALLEPAGAVKPTDQHRADAGRFAKAVRGVPNARRAPSLAARRAFDLFNRASGNRWGVRWSLETGAPASLRGGPSRAYGGSPEAAARAFLNDVRAFLQVDPARLKLGRSHERLGLHHLWFDQEVAGIPVEFGRVAVHLTGYGEVVHVDSNFDPLPPEDLSPAFSESEALRVVAQDLGAPSASGGGLVLLQTEDGLRLAWKFETYADAPLGKWAYYVDAKTGELLLRFNKYKFACSSTGATRGEVKGKVFDVDPYYNDFSLGVGCDDPGHGCAVERGVPNLTIYIGSPDNATATDADGCYGHPLSARIFASLQGPYAVVANHRAASAHYDNASGVWQSVPATAASPHPYPDNCPNTSCPESALTVSALQAPNVVAKVRPFFSRVDVGDMEGGEPSDDDEVVILSSNGVVLGRYVGDQGIAGGTPVIGVAVPGRSYRVRLESNAGGQHYGYDLAASSYLVVNTSLTADLATSGFTWTSTTTYDDSVNEINLFYHLNKMHDFINTTVNSVSTGATRAAAIDGPLLAMSHWGPGLNNAYYSGETRSLHFGNGDGNCAANNQFSLCLAFDGDGTVVRHEYTHFMVDQIFPLPNFGQAGAISEGLADYFSGTSFNTAPVPGIAAFARKQSAGNNSMYVPIRSMRPINDAGSNCPVHPQTGNTEKSVCFMKFPRDWLGEIHDDGVIMSQALWLLRPDSGRTDHSYELGLDTRGVRKSDRLAWEAHYFYPDSFPGFLEAMLTFAELNRSSLGFTDADIANIKNAFALHGISTTSAGGDSLEPNDGASIAVDLDSNQPVTATVYPAADLDAYGLSAAPGRFTATLELPASATEGIYIAYFMALLDSNLQVVAQGAPSYDVNPTGSGFCQDFVTCLTNSAVATLAFDVTKPGVYYILVGGGEGDFGSNTLTSSTSPYKLSATWSKAASMTGNVVTASFDQDRLSFSVDLAEYLTPVYRFSHARLRDHALNALPGTETNKTGSFLSLVSSSAVTVQVSTSLARGKARIDGTLQLASGFDSRFPSVGTVYLEVFGVNESSSTVSLGFSKGLNLGAAGGQVFKAFNNLFTPGGGSKVTFRYDVKTGGAASIKLYTVDGTLVKTLFEGVVLPGKASLDWFGDNSVGSTVASGVYLVRFESPDGVVFQKVVVVK